MMKQTLKDYLEGARVQALTESSWSRILQHIQGDRPFAVISAFVREIDGRKATWAENVARHHELEAKIRYKYGYIEQDSGYTYTDAGTGKAEAVREMSLFIVGIGFDEAVALGQAFDQETILIKDQDHGFVIVYTKDFIDKDGTEHRVGDVGMKFNTTRGQVTFDPAVLKYAYSKLKHGSKSQRGQEFAFTAECTDVVELAVPSRALVLTSRNNNVRRRRIL